MPTYDYKCDDCEHTFEHFQSIKADKLTDCPACEKPALRRLIGAGAGFIFKGSGFYITDYRSEGYKKDAKAAGGAPSGSDASSGTPSKPDSASSSPTTPSKSDSASSSPASSPSTPAS